MALDGPQAVLNIAYDLRCGVAKGVNVQVPERLTDDPEHHRVDVGAGDVPVEVVAA